MAIGIGAALLGSSAIGALGSIFGSDSAAGISKSAYRATEAKKREMMDFQRALMEQQAQDTRPWITAGQEALDDLWTGIQEGRFDVGQVDVTQDPGYQFRMQQGQEALDASAAARGRLLSGAQQKALLNYGQQMGSQEYGDAYNRQLNEKNRQMNMLSSMSGMGQMAQSQGAQQQLQGAGGLQNMTQLSAQNQMNYANQKAAARQSAYGGVAQAANQGISNWLLYNSLNSGGGASNPFGTGVMGNTINSMFGAG